MVLSAAMNAQTSRFAGDWPVGPCTAGCGGPRSAPDGIVVPLRLRTGDGVLSFVSTVTTFGTAVDVTAAELSVEAFLPGDAATAEALRRAAG